MTASPFVKGRFGNEEGDAGNSDAGSGKAKAAPPIPSRKRPAPDSDVVPSPKNPVNPTRLVRTNSAFPVGGMGPFLVKT